MSKLEEKYQKYCMERTKLYELDNRAGRYGILEDELNQEMMKLLREHHLEDEAPHWTAKLALIKDEYLSKVEKKDFHP